MGMSYQYAGSASYPRFENEIRLVANALGCAETDRIPELEGQAAAKPLGRWFGAMYGAGTEKPMFQVPDGLPPAVGKWLNSPYAGLTPAETESVWNEIKKHARIQAFSPQIWSELEWLARWHEGWDIS